jgi:hypothetical protein
MRKMKLKLENIQSKASRSPPRLSQHPDCTHRVPRPGVLSAYDMVTWLRQLCCECENFRGRSGAVRLYST